MDLYKEADLLLHGHGLLDILREYGEPHVIGSSSMDLMAWPDLDIDVIPDSMTIEKLHRLTRTLLERFSPLWYEGKKEVNDEAKRCGFRGWKQRSLEPFCRHTGEYRLTLISGKKKYPFFLRDHPVEKWVFSVQPKYFLSSARICTASSR